MPWLNVVSSEWLVDELSHIPIWLSLDNHYRIGGQGDRIGDAILLNNLKPKYFRLALEEIPVSGGVDEVLEYHKFTVEEIINFFNLV